MADNTLAVYQFIRFVAVSMGFVGLAAAGLMIVVGDSRQADKAKAAIRNIIIAVMVIWLMGSIVSMGKTIGKKYVWKPPTPASGIRNGNNDSKSGEQEAKGAAKAAGSNAVQKAVDAAKEVAAKSPAKSKKKDR